MIGHVIGKSSIQISNNQLILYALSIGFGQDPLNKEDFKFTYENDENFQSFFTMPVIVGHPGLNRFSALPMLESYDFNQLLHGEEIVEVFKPLVPDQKYTVEEKVIDFQDKTKMSALIEEVQIRNESTGELVSKLYSTLILRNIGGFGYKGTIKHIFPEIPKRNPDFIVEEKTKANQAFLYRLNGDRNPLHVDPEKSKAAGYDRPILHGLCTKGFSARAIYEKFCQSNPLMVKKMGSRFTSHVFPGETFVIEMWKEGQNVIFQTKTKERGLVSLKGYAELRENAKI